MKRREFLGASAAIALLPFSAQADTIAYTAGLVDQHLANGETVFVDFYAPWCSTCRAQTRVIDALREANPDYDANITFIQVDWDTYSNESLARRLNVPRRSTLVVLKGNMQLGMIVAGTSQRDIQALLDTALSAATA